ncbi:carbohydrate-binding protein [Streptomyces litchfieldiae]|uniref:CBM6 domain-containing protein n=1 Tax=Streptomyces litchfieldiae TaxID=3075543 RepID=A0ABU2MV41_9ACTN|nr:hypothetical protein [Streptomyces sp. DSM 44938]MDT0344409.1 hypothetical protein [Streptomyces sp. DSM 44938]
MRKSLRRLALAAATVTAAGLPVPPGAAAAEPDVLAVDFGETTGAFRGGASGTLYGFGDDGSPTQALINGAHITNSSQKPQDGLQHPSGDVLNIEDGFFDKHGRELAVYVQDFYPDWAYHGGVRPQDTRTYDQSDGSWTEGGNGTWDYLEVVRYVVTDIATHSAHPDKYLFVLFNEPDWIWYQDWPGMKDQFFADWTETYNLVHEIYDDVFDGAVEPRIGGQGNSHWYGSGEPADRRRERDFLEYADANDVLPDTYIWHELGTNPDQFRTNFSEYRALEDDILGTDTELPITISEWGLLTDMSTPGRIARWFAAFEEAKVDAQTAYWNYAGNFSDNIARANGANGGWWLFKWYGDLAGSDTVQVTPPSPGVWDSLRGVAAIDEDSRRATVLYGGTDADVTLKAGGLDPALFGKSVDVEVREITLTGAEGVQGTPRLVAAHEGVRLGADGTLADLTFPTHDEDSAYQVLITPRQARDVERTLGAQPWSRSIEAEDTELTQAAVRDATSHEFQASGDADVAWFNQTGSRSDFTVTVPRTGTYRLQVIGSAPAPGRHALFVDDRFGETVQYSADLSSTRGKWIYRGSAEIEVELPAGEHELSLRASRDGTTALPNSDITLDRYVLTDVTDGEPTVYPASTMRLTGGAHLAFDTARTRGTARIAGSGQRADLYATAWESGYHDVAIDFAGSGATSATLSVNGVEVGTIQAPRAGSWRSTAPVHLSQGINELEITSDSGVTISAVTTTRNRRADASAVTVEAEDATLHGSAAVTTLPDGSGTNASGGAFVGWLGNDTADSDNRLEIARRDGFDEPGKYTVVVRYANAETVGDHAYNPQVVDRGLQISEAGADGYAGRGEFRNNHHWDSFWERSVGVTLTTADGSLSLGNDEPGAWAPNVDAVTIAPVTAGGFRTTAR